MVTPVPGNAGSNDLFEAAERVASFIMNTGLIEAWREGAIYPSEMAFFLAVCEREGIEAVVESGRQDGYSTEILGRWAQTRSVDIFSIDLEQEHERAEHCRERLRALPLTLIKGNAYTEFGRVVRSLRGRRTAILIDGPKGWPALSMVAAAVDRHVKVVSLHNLATWTRERPWFASRGGCFYEDALPTAGPQWTEMRRREIRHASDSGAARSLEASSLGVMVLDDGRRKALARSFEASFGLHQPFLVRLFWDLGAYAFAPKLYGLSYRLLGR